MLNKIIDTCQKFNTAIEHRNNPSNEEMDIIQYFNIELAKSIIDDMDSHNAKQIAKIILAVTDDPYSSVYTTDQKRGEFYERTK